ncbi:MAG: PH domain-containing protein [Acidimicrobiales bacterium]
MAMPSEVEATAPRRLHPLSPFFNVVALARQLVAPGVVALTAGGVRYLLAVVVAVLGVRVVAWWRRCYRLQGGVLHVESGVLVRSQQLVPCDRIQQVNLVRKLRHRLLDVATVRVETAGGGDSSVELEVVSTEEAHRLRADLLAARTTVPPPARAGRGADGVGAEPAWVPTEWPVVALTYPQLAVAGLTGSELFVFVALLGWAFQLAEELPGDLLGQVDLGDVVGGLDLPLALGLGAVLVALSSASAVTWSILRNAGFTLTLVGDELHARRGLLDRREAVLPTGRIQAVRVTASPLRRAVGYVSVRLQSAGLGTESEERRVAVPILPAADLDRVLGLVLPGAVLPPLRRPPRVALHRAVVRWTAPTTAVAVPAAAAWPPGALALLAVPLAVGLGVATYRGMGHARLGPHLVTRRGALIRRTVIVPAERAQSGRVRATPFQRRVGLATLFVDVAGPGTTPRVKDEEAVVARRLLGQLMAEVGHH